MAANSSDFRYTYFKLWAKGPAAALALQHSGLEWEGAFPEDWKALKPTTPFLELPILETPSGTIGHELAILNYIGQQSQKMAGVDLTEFAISQQLLNQAEDMYQKLSKLKSGLLSGEEADACWTDENEQTHNRNFGFKVYLKLLEAFYKASGGSGGKFTTSGVTVGECKLFSTLHALKLIKDNILADYPELAGFYDRFAGEDATQAILKGEGKMPGTFDQYFKF
ncbi:GST1 [Symbiodinium natans]|uniref:GST1 protein n=1 Tax=Symbiodinium natans TaxID=878477 RepID=A0A812R6I4_9DINO|nr:GST1 [Symbiodinium natans]